MELHELLHILHLAVQRQFHPPEHLRHHPGPDVVVVVESPAQLIVPALALGLADVVEEGCPAQPDIGLERRLLGILLLLLLVASLFGPCHVLQHLQRVVEVVLVCPAVARLHEVEGRQFGNDEAQQSAALQLEESLARILRSHDLAQLLGYALPADDTDALGVA